MLHPHMLHVLHIEWVMLAVLFGGFFFGINQIIFAIYMFVH